LHEKRMPLIHELQLYEGQRLDGKPKYLIIF
jgi:hypothetical protein